VKYYYDKADLAGMKQELSTIDWEEKLSTQDENKQWKGFKDTVLCIQDKYTPKRKSRAATDRKGKTNTCKICLVIIIFHSFSVFMLDITIKIKVY
jgi:hypothetical protein